MKVGDLVEFKGHVGILSEIRTNQYPPYRPWYRIRWQSKEGFAWVINPPQDCPIKKL